LNYAGLLVILLDKINKQGHKLSNIMAGCILVGSVYWVAATYGAFTVLQVSKFYVYAYAFKTTKKAILAPSIFKVAFFFFFSKRCGS